MVDSGSLQDLDRLVAVGSRSLCGSLRELQCNLIKEILRFKKCSPNPLECFNYYKHYYHLLNITLNTLMRYLADR